ncbi:hypothetical protein MTP04_22180 [Lysinibacillus sp. PLM2]|nr:hypothetical protein MTP04_22180 [Lysinibacillus sp. PLM2]
MYQSRNRYLSGGYTLLEALYQLVVFILLTQIIIFIFIWINKQNQTFMTDENIPWEIFVNDLKKYLTNIENITVENNDTRLNINYRDSSSSIQISPINNVIRKQVNHTGHVPMLIGIKNLKFTLVENELTITVTLLNGEVKERSFFVQTRKE